MYEKKHSGRVSSAPPSCRPHHCMSSTLQKTSPDIQFTRLRQKKTLIYQHIISMLSYLSIDYLFLLMFVCGGVVADSWVQMWDS